jgi:hypothetical protein
MGELTAQCGILFLDATVSPIDGQGDELAVLAGLSAPLPCRRLMSWWPWRAPRRLRDSQSGVGRVSFRLEAGRPCRSACGTGASYRWSTQRRKGTPQTRRISPSTCSRWALAVGAFQPG